MELDLETKQLLADLIAKPSSVTEAHTAMLDNLVKTYPYYQPLHLLLAKASIADANHNHLLATAALYNNSTLLHQVMYQPETLTVSVIRENVTAIEQALPKTAESIVEEETFDEITEVNTVPQTSLTDEEEVYDEIAEFTVPVIKPVAIADEQETFDEIFEIDNHAFPTHGEAENSVAAVDTNEHLPDELAIESIVANDFFAFEKSFSTEQAVENTKEEAFNVVLQPEEYNLEAEAQTVSKYDDDKLPYTFLWWLAKTRKEHAQIFQPYVAQKKPDVAATTQPNELQQQYVEHIFHIQTPFNVADEAGKGPINKQVIPKGTDIIDSFIKNDPQIRVPKAEQINNENKAKKSAEDNYDLVSETLAAIYIEQTLYHKAIDTYEKLSLKFPEKSGYFADLIQSLEKKI